jgi:hypothetical protein
MKIKVPSCGQSEPSNLMDRDFQSRSLMVHWKIAACASLHPLYTARFANDGLGFVHASGITEQFIMARVDDERGYNVDMPYRPT